MNTQRLLFFKKLITFFALVIILPFSSNLTAQEYEEEARLTAFDGEYLDTYGYSVDIDGDFMAVGSYNDTVTHQGTKYNESGSVYIYHRNEGGTNNWGLIKKVLQFNIYEDADFGWSLDLNGDLLIVGAPNSNYKTLASGEINNSGSAHIFQKDHGGLNEWGEIKTLGSKVPTEGDRFGTKVAINDNFAVVSSYRDDHDLMNADSIENSGSIHIYSKDEGGSNNWGWTKKIVSPMRNENGFFGSSLDLNDDMLIVGEQGADLNQSGSNYKEAAGGAHIYYVDSGNFNFVQTITASDREKIDLFGDAVGIDNGYAVVGASGEDENAVGTDSMENSGSAYIFAQNEGGPDNWGEIQKITAEDAREADAHFGSPVAIRNNRIVVGATFADAQLGFTTLENVGEAYAYHRETSDSWEYADNIFGSESFAQSYFGKGIAINADYTVIGSQFESSSLSSDDSDGVVYIYENPTVTSVEDEEIPAEYTLYQNYPNPFNPTTTIEFVVPETTEATLDVYNILGKKVGTLFSGRVIANQRYEVNFNAENLASGIYLYKLKTPNFVQTRKMMLIK